jgi:hypothetical protein
MRIHPALIILPALLAAPLRVAAQDCTLGNLPDDSHEAEIFKIRGAATAFGRATAPSAYHPGGIVFLMEGATLQTIDDETATPTYCRAGKPPENVNLMSVLPRPRVIFAALDGMTLEASWIPPIPVNGVKANVFGLAVARTVTAGPGLLSLRAAATLGEIRAPITCTEDQIAVDPGDPAATECAGGEEPSNDLYKPNSYSVDLTYGWVFSGGKFRPYIGGGANFLRPRFQVDFVDQFGDHQDQKVETNMTRPAFFGGATFAPSTRIGMTGEYYADPGTAWTARFSLHYVLK